MDSASQKLNGMISKEKQQNMDPVSCKLTGEEKSSPTTQQGNPCREVDWGPHDSSFFLFLKYIDQDGKPKDLFTQGLWG